MTSITRTERLNRKLFASVICGLFVCCFSLLLIIERNFTKKITGMEMVPESSTTNSHQACFQRTIHRHKNAYEIRYLEDVLETDRKPKAGESIIFHKTTCSRSGLVHLNSRYWVLCVVIENILYILSSLTQNLSQQEQYIHS